MKNLITFVLTLLLFSCAKEEKPEYTIISGKLTNNIENDKFSIIGNSFKKDINVNKDGSFTDTLHIDYNGAYYIRGLAGQTPIYLHKGKNLSFESHSEEMEDISFSGDLAIENNYLVQKSKIEKESRGSVVKDFYLVEEDVFLAKIEALDNRLKDLLEKTNFSVEGFKEKELKSIDYYKNLQLRNFIDYQEFYGDENFKVSDNFPKTDDIADFENVEDYNFSVAYRSLVRNNFFKIAEEEIGDDNSSEKYYQAVFNTYKTLKSQNIKNSFAPIASQAISPSNNNSEEVYNYVMTNVTDENFKTELTEKYNKIKTLAKGKPSPKFDYENHKGGTTSLDDLKGKYVYIDVWATWCGPCKREIPFLKEVEKQYHGKNIEFVSISIDETEDHNKWKEFVTQEELGGVQLYADNAWQSQFVKDYAIEGIPRFILVDTEGNIVSADAPRPSDQKLIELFTEIGL